MQNPKTFSLESFLDIFFKSPNRVNITAVQQDQRGEFKFIRECIAYLQQPNPSFTILPYVLSDKPSMWCGIAFNREQANEMRSLLNSFVGDTYSDIKRSGLIKSDTEVGRAIQAYAGGEFAIKFNGDFRKVMAALQLMNKVRQSIPQKTLQSFVSRGNLIRSFTYALEVKDHAEAKRLLQEIERRKFLDATNLSFLDVLVKVAFEQWTELYQSDRFSRLLSVRRPRLVTQALTQALYLMKLKSPFEDNLDVEGALQVFREEVYPQYSSLFSTWSNTTKAEVLKIWMIKHLAGLHTDQFQYEHIVASANAIGLKDALWQALLVYKAQETTEAPTVSTSEVHEAMLKAFQIGNLLAAKEYAILANDTAEKASILFHCASALEDPSCFNLFLTTKRNLPQEATTRLEKNLHRTSSFLSHELQWLTEEDYLPTNWIEFIERINKDESFAKKQALKMAEEIAVDWTSAEFWSIDRNVSQLVDALSSSRTAVGEEVLNKVVPHLVAFLWKDETHQAKFTPIYNILFDVLATTEQLNRGELLTINELLRPILSADDLTKDRYREVINGIIGLLPYYQSPYSLDCLIDLLDIVLHFTVLSKDDVLRLMTQTRLILNQIEKLKEIEEQKELFNSYCAYLNVGELQVTINNEEAQAQKETWSYYANKRIGIYTLTEDAAKRAETFLENLALNIQIQINHDHVGSTNLKNMAREAEVLVIVTGSAKHAATNFIKQHRGNKPVLYPIGKGSSSILTVLKEYALDI